MMSEGVGLGPWMKSRYEVRVGGARAWDEVKVIPNPINVLVNGLTLTMLFTRYTQAHYASRTLLDVDMHCMEGRGLWSHANSCGVSL